MALTLSRTGMRLGEVVALQWSDVDFESWPPLNSIEIREGAPSEDIISLISGWSAFIIIPPPKQAQSNFTKNQRKQNPEE